MTRTNGLPDLDETNIQILGFIRERHTYQEMADALSRSAKSGIYRRVRKLIDLGLVTKTPMKSRSRRLTEDGKRILDSVLAERK